MAPQGRKRFRKLLPVLAALAGIVFMAIGAMVASEAVLSFVGFCEGQHVRPTGRESCVLAPDLAGLSLPALVGILLAALAAFALGLWLASRAFVRLTIRTDS